KIAMTLLPGERHTRSENPSGQKHSRLEHETRHRWRNPKRREALRMMLAVRSHQMRTTRVALRAQMDVRWRIALRRNRLADYRILSGLVANGCGPISVRLHTTKPHRHQSSRTFGKGSNA